MSRFDQCPEHGDVISVKRHCPWCDAPTTPAVYPSPIHQDLQRAVEAITLLHLTEPKAYHHDDE